LQANKNIGNEDNPQTKETAAFLHLDNGKK